MDVSPRLRAGLLALGALTALGVVAYAAHVAFGLGSPGLDDFFQDWVYCGVSVGAGAICVLRGLSVRRERPAWLVMAVCDAFDAMTTERPYREAVTEADAIQELRRCSGTQFDPLVVEAFCRVIARERPAHGEVLR